jgi:cellulose synthase (UDP-forming)
VRVPVKLGFNGELRDYFASDISVSGMHLIGELPVPIGTPVRIRFSDICLEAHVRRRTESGFGLQFETTDKAKASVLRYIFSGPRAVTNGKIKPHLLARAVAARVFR